MRFKCCSNLAYRERLVNLGLDRLELRHCLLLRLFLKSVDLSKFVQQ